MIRLSSLKLKALIISFFWLYLSACQSPVCGAPGEADTMWVPVRFEVSPTVGEMNWSVLWRIYVYQEIYQDFLSRFLSAVAELKLGDPREEDTDVGPVIDNSAAQRIEDWLKEAKAAGAKILCGGEREGRMIQATVLSEVDPSLKISCQEVFAPVVTIMPYSDFSEAVKLIDDSRYGLQAGVFTRDIKRIFQAFNSIEVGGLIVNDIPTYRIEHMPYGGVKDSGLGREGLRYAIEEMTELKLMVLNLA